MGNREGNGRGRQAREKVESDCDGQRAREKARATGTLTRATATSHRQLFDLVKNYDDENIYEDKSSSNFYKTVKK